jgi:hypothetical protein
MRLIAPDLNAKRARLADWVELQALTSARRLVSLSSLRSLIRRLSDERISVTERDPDAEHEAEPEITEGLSDDLQERVAEELAFRVESVGDAYPFQLITEQAGRSQRLELRTTWETVETGQLIYVFCLLDSAIRDGLVECPRSLRSLADRIGNMFQICSCLAVAGYTNAEVVSFGFPRATGHGFLPALQAAWARHGSYPIRKSVPYGWPNRLKDGGIDIIAWRHFADRCAATLVMFVQVASGQGWKDKAVRSDVDELFKWFDGSTPTHFLPAICIPFPLWFEQDEPTQDQTGKKLAFSEGVRNRFVYHEGKFGIIFDRGRIARSAAHALTAAAAGALARPVDGIDRVHEVASWVVDAMSSLADARAEA